MRLVTSLRPGTGLALLLLPLVCRANDGFDAIDGAFFIWFVVAVPLLVVLVALRCANTDILYLVPQVLLIFLAVVFYNRRSPDFSITVLSLAMLHAFITGMVLLVQRQRQSRTGQ